MCTLVFVDDIGSASNFGDLANLFDTKAAKIPTLDGQKITKLNCCLCPADIPAAAKKFGYSYKYDVAGYYILAKV